MSKMKVNIVSMQESIFSGEAKFLSLTGLEGDLGIAPNHAPLLTKIMPGPVVLTDINGKTEIFYIQGGFLEVQPTIVTILANIIHRTDDLDEEQAKQAKERAEKHVAKSMTGDFDYALARTELVRAHGLLRTLKEVRTQIERIR